MCESKISKKLKLDFLYWILGHILAKSDKNLHSQLLSGAAGWFDEAILANCRRALGTKSAANAWRHWLEANKDICCFFMQEEDVDAVLAVTGGEYKLVAAQLARLHFGTRTGEMLFQFPRDLVASKVLAESIAENMKLVAQGKFAPDVVKRTLNDAEAKQRQMLKKKSTRKLDIDVSVLSMNTTMQVSSAVQEWEAKYFALVKSSALGLVDGLPILEYEKLLLGETNMPNPVTHTEVRLGCKAPFKTKYVFPDLMSPITRLTHFGVNQGIGDMKSVKTYFVGA